MMAPIDPRLRFDPNALLAAVDVQRQARGLSWQALAQRLHVSASTMRGMPMRASIECDGVLQMTWWLGRSVESFPTRGTNNRRGPTPGDWASTGSFLRADTRGLYEAVDRRRLEHQLTWTHAAAQIWPPGYASPATLTSLAAGGRIDVWRFLAIAAWLETQADRFTRLVAA